MELTEDQLQLVARSYDVRITRRRQYMVLAFGGVAAIVALVLSIGLPNRLLLGVMAALYVVVTVCEKWAFGNGVLRYKAVIRQLDARVKELEQSAQELSDDPPQGDRPASED